MAKVKNKSESEDKAPKIDFEASIIEANYYRDNPFLPSKNTVIAYTEDMVKEIAKCKKDIIYFAQNYFTIVNLDRGKEIVKLYPVQKKILKQMVDNNRVVLVSSRQMGKALGLDTPIPTPNGFTTMGQLKDNDEVYDENGNICHVVKAHDVLYGRKCYKVTFDNGEEIIADAEHLWFTQTKSDRHRGSNGAVRTTEEIKNTLCSTTNEPNHRIPKAKGVAGKHKDLPIDPYLLGYWLGDGSSADARLTIGKLDFDEVFKLLNPKEYSIYEDKNKNFMLNIKGGLKTLLRTNNLQNNKHIPEEYLLASYEQRLELLKGLMDTDGHVEGFGRISSFCSSNIKLFEDVKKLVLSLGIKIHTRVKKAKKITHNDANILWFSPNEHVFKIRRKYEKQVFPLKNYKTQFLYIKKIEDVESVPVRCITVDSPNSLYLCGNTYIPTHNTTMFSIFALWYTTFFNDKTILIVANKEKTATEILSRVRTAFELLPAFLKPAIKEWQKQSIEFINGSKILITSSSSTAGRSASCNVLLIDECAHLLDHQADDFFTSVLPVISSSKNTKIFLASTPNGCSNYFYRTFKQATETKGGGGWTYARVPWYDIPGRDAKWKEIALADVNYNMEKFRQEYECDFLETSESAIDPELLVELTENIHDPEILNTPEYKVWEKPDRRKIYTIGCDVSDGVGGCASCIQVFDVTDLKDIKQVACYNNRYIDTTSFASKIHEIAKQWGKPWLMIEKNAMGHEVITLLSSKPYNYERILGYSDREKEDTIKPGIMSSTNTKYTAVSNMRYWINTSRTVTLRDKETLSEMRTFTKQDNGTWKKKRGEGIFDDRVMATCWAIFPLVTSIANKIYDVVEFGNDGKPTKVTNTFFEDLEDSDFNMANLRADVFRDEDDGFIGGMIPYRTNPNLNEGIEDLMMSGWSLQ